jgi:PncC family amidohydrolase
MFNIAKDFWFAYNNSMKLVKKVAVLLTQRNQTLSLAESCTGGFLSHCLTNIPGSSKFFKIGIIAYANEAKEKLLGVPSSTLKKYGAVSLPSIRQMAQGARLLLKTDFGLAISGIAGPGGSTPKKPLGLTFIAISSKNKTHSFRFIFKGSRLSVKKQAASKALEILLEFLHESK